LILSYLIKISIDTPKRGIMERPSWGELSKKIQLANELVSDNAINIIDPTVIAADAIELGYQIKELQKVLLSVLGEITPKEYAGTRPPQKSYKEQITGSELYAFRWKSKFFGCETYLKFCLKETHLYLVSLHPHREGKGD
jgi:hypothetical protein